MIIAVDFDGTIVEHAFPEVGALRPHARDVLARLVAHGHTVTIWTCRYTGPELANMLRFLEEAQIPHHHINENPPWLDFQPRPKIYADVYIDDRALINVTTDWHLVEHLLGLKGCWGKEETHA